MKVLIYGAGVIGSYIAHEVCACGHETILLARGKRKEELEKQGLVIYHQIQKKETVDKPIITDRINGSEAYDAVIAVMQHQQMKEILDDLASVHAKVILLIGNNPTAGEYDAYLKEHITDNKKVLFGFSGTAGRRENGKLICARLGAGEMTLGELHQEPDEKTKVLLAKIFTGKYKVTYVADADAWLKNHAFCVLPMAYLAYAHDCDLTRVTFKECKDAVHAMCEAITLLKAAGYPIQPESDEKIVSSGALRQLFAAMYYLIFKIRIIGQLAVSDHCKNAREEISGWEQCFYTLRGKHPQIKMPVWDSLRVPILPQPE